MVMKISVSQQISTYLHEQASLAIILLAVLQETIKHTGSTLLVLHALELQSVTHSDISH